MMPQLWVFWLNSICSLLILNFLAKYASCKYPTIHGRYTRNLRGDYQLTVPRKVSADGEFISYSLPHYFERNFNDRRGSNDDGVDGAAKPRRRRTNYGLAAPEKAVSTTSSAPWDPLHYVVTMNGVVHRLNLSPNRDFVAPHLVFERRAGPDVSSGKLKRLTEPLCHYTGSIEGHEGSRVALSTCEGLAGYLMTNGSRYFIEPVWSHVPNEKDQLMHVVYQRPDAVPEGAKGRRRRSRCASTEKWQDAWERRFYREFSTGGDRQDAQRVDDGRKADKGPKDHGKRAGESARRYLETLVVADKKFLEFHKNSDYQTYILTIMNMVSDFYHDATVGNQIDVVVVRLMFLEKEEKEIDLVINGDADATLASFCKWQQTINPKDINNPNHHDIAILLTRHDICANNMSSCGLMGLAYMASACTGDRSCAINEDNGLALGVTVAHEMGHIMGSSHDSEQESGCNPDAPDESSHVMSPFVQMHTSVWSACSRKFITTFFDNDLGECLNDEPQESLFPKMEMPPGAMYDADYQCNLNFPGSTVCAVDSEEFCTLLKCRTSPLSCTNLNEPPADGTKCGENLSEYSECSRSCGAGIQISERKCDNPTPQHNGRFCIGERKSVKICNTDACPVTAKSFRSQQCTEYNSKPFQEKWYEWDPYIKSDDPCTLYCINSEKVYTKMAPRAKDGTKCKPGTKNMCVFGVCRKVGCDWELDSDATEDQCGLCKGDGTQCTIVDAVFDDPVTKEGYVKVTTVPRGSTNIMFEELKPSPDIIAVSSLDGNTFYLNGESTEQLDGNVNFDGDMGVYSHTEPNKETLLIHGPLKADIILLVAFFDHINVGYRYRYAEPNARVDYRPLYHWESVEWGECSARCGGGIQMALVECIEETSGKVSAEFCEGIKKLETPSRKCKEQPCMTKWRVGKWRNCTACRFYSGVRDRLVECVRENPIAGEDDILVEDSECRGQKPGTRQLCNAEKKCPERKGRDMESENRSKRSERRKRKRKPRSHSEDNYDDEDLHLDDNLMQQLWLQTVGWERGQHAESGGDENEAENEAMILSRIRRDGHEAKNPRSQRYERDPAGNGYNGMVAAGEERKEIDASEITVPPFKVGSIVKDTVAEDRIKVIEEPLKQSHLALNLSDTAFEQLGDKVPDSVDKSHRTVHTGKNAAELLQQMRHSNVTDEPDRK